MTTMCPIKDQYVSDFPFAMFPSLDQNESDFSWYLSNFSFSVHVYFGMCPTLGQHVTT